MKLRLGVEADAVADAALAGLDAAGHVVVARADLIAYLNRGTGDLRDEADALNRLLAAAGSERTPTFAWCFDHGRLHTIRPSRTWCTANWIALDGSEEEEALRDKRDRFGDALFLYGLSAGQRALVLAACAERRSKG